MVGHAVEDDFEEFSLRRLREHSAARVIEIARMFVNEIGRTASVPQAFEREVEFIERLAPVR